MTRVNPFTPGYGGMPPYLAGREAEQSLFADALATLRAGKPSRGIVMYGPRGMGKTVLLNWVKKQCDKAGITSIVTAPAIGLRSPADLPDLLLKGRALPNEISAGLWRFFTLKWKRDDDHGNAVAASLVKACRRRPRVLLLDEAHTLEPAACRALLNIAQIATAEAPFLLVLAGTPGLMPYLKTIKATFVDRSEKIGVGALSTQSAKDAIRIPLAEENIGITEDALDLIAADSQKYPFFLQEWGKAIWRHAREHNSAEATLQHAEALSGGIREQRADFYKERYKSMMGDDDALLIAADAVGKVVLAEGGLEFDEVTGVIAAGLAGHVPDDIVRAKAKELARELNRIDYIWNPPKSDKMRAGIPSFMAYVSERAAKKAARAAGV